MRPSKQTILIVLWPISLVLGFTAYWRGALGCTSFFVTLGLCIAIVSQLRSAVPQRYLEVCQWIASVLLTIALLGASDEGATIAAEFLTKSDATKYVSLIQKGCIAAMFAVLIVQFGLLWLKQSILPDIDELERKLESAKRSEALLAENFRGLIIAKLREIALELGFGDNDHSEERITVYVVDGNNSDKCFVNTGRYSLNPIYDKVGRPAHRVDKGFIGEAYQKRWVYGQFDGDAANLVQWNRSSGLTKNTADNLSMPSKLYCGLSLRIGGKVLAVIIIEATDPNRFTEQHLRDFVDQHRENWEDFFITIQRYISVPSYAKGLGF